MTRDVRTRPALAKASSLFAVFVLALGAAAASAQPQPPAPYFPDAEWKRMAPAEAGIDPRRLKEAIDFAIASESKNPRDLTLNHYRTFGREPFGFAIGPIKDRGAQTGVIVYKGYIVAEWGEPARVDMTHSVTKSFLTTTVGLAWQRGLIRDVTDTVREDMPA